MAGVTKGKAGNKPGNKIALFGLSHRAVGILAKEPKPKTAHSEPTGGVLGEIDRLSVLCKNNALF